MQKIIILILSLLSTFVAAREIYVIKDKDGGTILSSMEDPNAEYKHLSVDKDKYMQKPKLDGAGRIEGCKSLESLLKTIMRARQVGVPMSEVYEQVKAEGNPKFEQATKQMVIEVYNFPLLDDQESKDMLVVEYGNRFFSQCVNP